MTASRSAIDLSVGEPIKTTMSICCVGAVAVFFIVFSCSLADLHRQLKSCYRSMGGCWPRNSPPDLFRKTPAHLVFSKAPNRLQSAAPKKRPKSTLTFDLRPTQRAVKWRPDTLWDHRHHVAVSKQNLFLHMTHKEFFDVPQAYDYKTKPRTPLEPTMIERSGRLAYPSSN